MSGEQELRQLMIDYIEKGLVEQDEAAFLALLTEPLMGFGMTEQGFICTRQAMQLIFRQFQETQKGNPIELSFEQIRVQFITADSAMICGSIRLFFPRGERVQQNVLQQTLIARREQGAWKICGFHASQEVASKESLTVYPIQLSKQVRELLKKQLGDQVFAREEQYRQAILPDAIAFYDVNISKNRVERSLVSSPLCLNLAEGTPFFDVLTDIASRCLVPPYDERYLKAFSRENVTKVFDEGEKGIRLEYLVKTTEGRQIWVQTDMRLLVDVVTGERKALIYVQNIDKRKRQELKLALDAETDSLTGLYNRRGFFVRMERLAKKDAPGVFLLLDLDDFKLINDSYGHPAGDRVLTEVADILCRHRAHPERDLVCRLGGDEFVMYIGEVFTRQELLHFVESINRELQNIQLRRRVSGSIGVVRCNLALQSIDDIYARVDAALYKSKGKGKSGYVIL